LDERLAETRKQIWAGRDLPWPVALVVGKRTPFGEGIQGDARSEVSAAYGVVSYPTQVLIDRRGAIVGKFHPDAEGIALLEKALNDK
jgi:hypothetical protein